MGHRASHSTSGRRLPSMPHSRPRAVPLVIGAGVSSALAFIAWKLLLAFAAGSARPTPPDAAAGGQAVTGASAATSEHPPDVEVLRDQRLDHRDLVAVGRVGLDQQVVDLGCDDVRVLLDERREDVRLADRVEHRLARPVAAGQDEPDGRTLVAGDRRDALVRGGGGDRGDPGRLDGARAPQAEREVGGRQRQDHVLAVAGDDDQRARARRARACGRPPSPRSRRRR